MQLGNLKTAIIVTSILIGSSLTARAATLYPTDTLQITFTTSAPSCPSGPCDALLVHVTEDGAFFNTAGISSLFNGTSLLGTDSELSFCCNFTFRSASSLSAQGAIVDFTSIDNGSINGVIDINILDGYLTWLGDPTADVTLARATGLGDYSGGTGVTITSVSILTPEPNAASLAVTGLSALILIAALRRRERFSF